MNLIIRKNYIWNMLDQGSQLYILELAMGSKFVGEVQVIGRPVVKEDESIVVELFIIDEEGKEINLPIDILEIMNN